MLNFRKLLLVGVAALVVSPAFATERNWFKIYDKNGAYEYEYVDLNSEKFINPYMKKVTTVEHYDGTAYHNFGESLVLDYEIDCVDGKFRETAYAWYSEDLAVGNLLSYGLIHDG